MKVVFETKIYFIDYSMLMSRETLKQAIVHTIIEKELYEDFLSNPQEKNELYTNKFNEYMKLIKDL